MATFSLQPAQYRLNLDWIQDGYQNLGYVNLLWVDTTRLPATWDPRSSWSHPAVAGYHLGAMERHAIVRPHMVMWTYRYIQDRDRFMQFQGSAHPGVPHFLGWPCAAELDPPTPGAVVQAPPTPSPTLLPILTAAEYERNRNWLATMRSRGQKTWPLWADHTAFTTPLATDSWLEPRHGWHETPEFAHALVDPRTILSLYATQDGRARWAACVQPIYGGTVYLEWPAHILEGPGDKKPAEKQDLLALTREFLRGG